MLKLEVPTPTGLCLVTERVQYPLAGPCWRRVRDVCFYFQSRGLGIRALVGLLRQLVHVHAEADFM
jgi:hypothetical protein